AGRHVAGDDRVDGFGRDAGARQDLARDLDAEVDRVGVGERAHVVDHGGAYAIEDEDVVEELALAAGHEWAFSARAGRITPAVSLCRASTNAARRCSTARWLR